MRWFVLLVWCLGGLALDGNYMRYLGLLLLHQPHLRPLSPIPIPTPLLPAIIPTSPIPIILHRKQCPPRKLLHSGIIIRRRSCYDLFRLCRLQLPFRKGIQLIHRLLVLLTQILLVQITYIVTTLLLT